LSVPIVETRTFADTTQREVIKTRQGYVNNQIHFVLNCRSDAGEAPSRQRVPQLFRRKLTMLLIRVWVEAMP